ncbi:MAG TPA: multidrug ABC transporter permease, partial [Burkholderiaceae bacterium]
MDRSSSPRTVAEAAPPRRGLAGHALQALAAVVRRDAARFLQQKGRLVSALVRPLLWLAVFAAGLRDAVGGA